MSVSDVFLGPEFKYPEFLYHPHLSLKVKWLKSAPGH